MTNEPETEVVTVDRFADLHPDDIVVETVRANAGDQVRVRRVLPPKPVLPTTDGSIVVQSVADSRDEPRWSAFLLDGVWLSTENGQHPAFPEEWRNGWALVYEAPAVQVDEDALQNLVSNMLYRYDNDEHFGVISFVRRILTFLKEGN